LKILKKKKKKMVFYFTSNVVDPPAMIYMGKDKYENEDLIKYGWEEDVWFHVDKLSSAHVYLRLQKGVSLDDIHPDVLEDCCQLVKANSIEGNKLNDVDVVYTPWNNLKKTGDMDVGQIGFFSNKMVRKVRVEKRVNEIVNRLNKTKVEKYPDLNAEKEAKLAEEREIQKKIIREKEKQERLIIEERKKMAEQRSYDRVMKPSKMSSNHKYSGDVDVNAAEEDFM